ncbi:MAG TPA: pyridoxamine 5'-phosphate oxidase family protein [Actinomycetota bacterium]|nr:pyridoxamine 5'-phosphate oxidase family protein [Actinomycetota bacterium]
MADPPSERTQVKRHADRAVYDRGTIHAILDEALFCHVAVVVDRSPRVIPTIHARSGDTLFIHGSNASRTLRALKDGAEGCIVVTLLDGLILARSAFNHSMNYRSVLVYGSLREITDQQEKWEAQRALVEHIVPGRSADARMPNEKELRQTTILAIPLNEASAKVRTGPSIDTEEDYDLPVWAGEIPLKMIPQPPIDDPRLPPGVDVPEYARRYRRPR